MCARACGRPQIRDRLLEEMAKVKMGQPDNFTNFMSAVIDKTSFGAWAAPHFASRHARPSICRHDQGLHRRRARPPHVHRACRRAVRRLDGLLRPADAY